MGFRHDKGKAQLLVKWEGETMRKATWEPVSSFDGAAPEKICQAGGTAFPPLTARASAHC